MIAFRHEPAYTAIRYQLCDVRDCSKIALHPFDGRAVCGHHRLVLAAKPVAQDFRAFQQPMKEIKP